MINEQKIKNIVLQNIKINDKRIEMLNKYNVNYVAWENKKQQNFSWVDLDNSGAIKLL